MHIHITLEHKADQNVKSDPISIGKKEIAKDLYIKMWDSHCGLIKGIVLVVAAAIAVAGTFAASTTIKEGTSGLIYSSLILLVFSLLPMFIAYAAVHDKFKNAILLLMKKDDEEIDVEADFKDMKSFLVVCLSISLTLIILGIAVLLSFASANFGV